MGHLHRATLAYTKTAEMQESRGWDGQRHVLGSHIMILEKKRAWVAAAIKLLYRQLFLEKTGHLTHCSRLQPSPSCGAFAHQDSLAF